MNTSMHNPNILRCENSIDRSILYTPNYNPHKKKVVTSTDTYNTSSVWNGKIKTTMWTVGYFSYVSWKCTKDRERTSTKIMFCSDHRQTH